MTHAAVPFTQSLDPAARRIGLVGLGQMGRGIARCLDRAGWLMGATDIDPMAFSAANLTDEAKAMSVAALMLEAEIIIFVVPTTQDIRSAIAAAPLRSGSIVVDLTTSAPMVSASFAADLAAQGVDYLDAGMTGGAAGADAGQLTLMVGGKPDVLARSSSVLSAFAAQIFHMGPVSSGHATKLVHNMILHSIFLATCEGMQVAEAAGLDPHNTVAVLNAGNARSFVSEVRFPRDILSGTMHARSSVSNLEKDLSLAVEFCTGIGRDAPYGSLTRDLLRQAVAEGMALDDFAHLYPRFEALARHHTAGLA
jgi:3-hydroxyisobutyrate dehydrogenase